jgi:hypothetical protein
MRNLTKLFLLAAAIVPVVNCGSAMAQSGDTVKFYRLDFVMKEMEQGKVVNSRSYSTLVSTDATQGRDRGSIRAGTRIPISTMTPGVEGNLQYIDVGVNIDCNGVHLNNGQLVLSVNADVSTLAMDPMREGPGMMAGGHPMPDPAPSKERGSTAQKDSPEKDGPDEAMPPMPPPPAAKGEQPLRTPPPGTRTNMMMMSSMRAPVIRQNKWSAVATVPLGKPTTLFASDDIASKKRMEVELTATEVR